ncbi:MAG: hypothetical protein AAGK04_01055 [Planctomycetota bacterium]
MTARASHPTLTPRALTRWASTLIACAIATTAWAQPEPDSPKPPAPKAEPADTKPPETEPPEAEPSEATPTEATPVASPEASDAKSAETKAVTQPESPTDELPSLDELLGLEEEDTPPATDDAMPIGPLDPDAMELDRRLSGEEIPDEIESAVGLMGDVASRLQTSMDTGLTTQRIQEDIIRKLDQVIEAAQEQQQQSSSSSSSGDPSGDPNQQPPQPQQGQQQQQAGEGDNQSESTPPGRQDGNLNPQLAPSRAAWGSLPERTRDALLQGSGDRFSAMYERLTEAYYKRLAEEAQR